MSQEYNPLNKIELAIEKLTEVSVNLDKMVSVHDQRLTQHEKLMNNLESVLEKRREESELKLYDVYDTIKSEDKNILSQLNDMRIENSKQYETITGRIIKMEKTIWLYMGMFSALVFLMVYGQNILKIMVAAK